MPTLSDDQKQNIVMLLKAGKKIDAIKAYREATSVDLKTAKEAVEAIVEKERIELPAASGCGSSAAILLAAGGALAYLLLR